VAALLVLCAMQTVQAGPVMRFMEATAQALHAPAHYIREVQRPPEQPARQTGGS